MPRATLIDFSDREVLHVLDDLSTEGTEWWVSTEALAEQMFGSRNGHGPDVNARRCIAIRMAWMRRYGVVEKHPTDGLWRLNDAGRRFLAAKLRRAEENTLARLEEEQLVPVLTALGRRYRGVSRPGAVLMRREWQRETTS